MSYLKRVLAIVLCISLYMSAVACSNIEPDITSDDNSSIPISSDSTVSDQNSGPDSVASSEPSAESVTESSLSDDLPSEENSGEEDSWISPDSEDSEFSESDDTSSEDSCDDASEPACSRFSVISPKVGFNKVWESGGMELYNTDFRISDELLSKFAARFASFGNAQSVALIELETNMAFTYSKDTKIATASSIKGPMGLFAYKCIDDGVISWDTVKTYQPRHFQEHSTGYVQDSPFGTPFTVKTLMDYMIRISDNQAYLMIKELVGTENFEKMMSALGSSRIIPKGHNWGYITAWEMASVWREIYFYSLSGKSGAELFDRYMHARYNYIWRSIPQYETAHKSGWSGKAFNDAGVVMADGHNYAIAVLMGRSGMEDETSQFQFTCVTRLLADLMVEYNEYIENGNISETGSTEK